MSEDIPQVPRTFTDAKGAIWDVGLTLASARRVDASDFSEITETKFSILKPDRQLFTTLISDTPLIFAVIWAACQPQAEINLGISPKEDPEGAEAEFLERINGSAVEEGRKAFWGALSDFFPEHRTALLTLTENLDKANRKIGERIRLMGPELDNLLEKEIDQEMDKLKDKLKEEVESEV